MAVAFEVVITDRVMMKHRAHPVVVGLRVQVEGRLAFGVVKVLPTKIGYFEMVMCS